MPSQLHLNWALHHEQWRAVTLLSNRRCGSAHWWRGASAHLTRPALIDAQGHPHTLLVGVIHITCSYYAISDKLGIRDLSEVAKGQWDIILVNQLTGLILKSHLELYRSETGDWYESAVHSPSYSAHCLRNLLQFHYDRRTGLEQCVHMHTCPNCTVLYISSSYIQLITDST